MFFGGMTIKERLSFGASAIAISVLSAGILVLLGVAMWKEGHDAIALNESVECDEER